MIRFASLPLFILLLTTMSTFGQSAPAATSAQTGTEGVVQYERRTNWPRLSTRMTFLSQEQKDRIVNRSRNWESSGEKMKLVFSETQSLYGYASESSEYEGSTYRGRNAELHFYRDFDKEQLIDVEETLGKTYIVEDSLRLPAWKIGDQIREIAGHMCSQATTTNPLKEQTITAWFAQDIPVPAGPEKYAGLPGLILELDINNGDVVIEAKKVEFKSVSSELKPPKVKGKRITTADFDKMLKNHITTSIKDQENPYWSIRY